ncbi:four helix bundle protein [Alistipes sp. ZOR0009]|jgi:four helix bundle protein|uniref:four helix bundle protein n=1 Tax=Alistipes sp. ZOR0009 TaxID=1339253 RepID=UPI000648452E|nr:four helix bundle protein [Alistipes sp. ZOR0009]
MHNFKELVVWQKSHAFVLEIYTTTRKFPKEEVFGITNQLRRASVSIEANIAEGAGRSTPNDFMRFIDMSNGSSFEVETLLLLCKDLAYLSEEENEQLLHKLDEIQKMLYKLREHLLQKTKEKK